MSLLLPCMIKSECNTTLDSIMTSISHIPLVLDKGLQKPRLLFPRLKIQILKPKVSFITKPTTATPLTFSELFISFKNTRRISPTSSSTSPTLASCSASLNSPSFFHPFSLPPFPSSPKASAPKTSTPRSTYSPWHSSHLRQYSANRPSSFSNNCFSISICSPTTRVSRERFPSARVKLFEVSSSTRGADRTLAPSETSWKNARSALREVVSAVVNDAWMSVKVVVVLVNKAVRAVSIPSCI